MKRTQIKRAILCATLAFVAVGTLYAAELKEPIDRRAVVERHQIKSAELMERLPVGNGNFCFNVDGTGLQTFSGDTLSHWGWFSEPLPSKYEWKDVPKTGTYSQGRLSGGDPFPQDRKDLYSWIRNSPHQMNLARVRLTKADGTPVDKSEIANVKRQLNIWTGVHSTSFEFQGETISVSTCVSDDVEKRSILSVKINCDAKAAKLLAVEIAFPYPNLKRDAWTGDFSESAPQTPFKVVRKAEDSVVVQRTLQNEYAENTLGDYSYDVRVDAPGLAVDQLGDSSTLRIALAKDGDKTFNVAFYGKDYRDPPRAESPAVNDATVSYEDVEKESKTRWESYWTTGGAVDFSESSDPRWFELERRVVLSQFLLRANSAGDWPSSESGLLEICPWSGRFHLEMVLQHLIHWWAWDRAEFGEKAAQIYEVVTPGAKALAEQLDYKGLKWQKEIAPDGRTAPWVGNLALLWKQPHPIFFAEMDYRRNPTTETLKKWEAIVEGTADHMADYATVDENGVYHLDPVMPPDEQGFTKDDLFDLAYWRWGLDAANAWRERLGKERCEEWDRVRANLAPLPQKDGYYVHSAEWTDTFEKRAWEHPDLIGIWGMIPPTDAVDKETATRTLERIVKEWNWDRTWGWDYPWVGLAGARLNRPEIAVDGLLIDSTCNKYALSGANLGGPSARGGKGPYLPGNAGLLYAIAGMCAGFDETAKDGATDAASMPRSGDTAPGFPDGWKVKWENLKRPL